MSKRPIPVQPKKQSRSGVRLNLEQLEDRCMPHSGVVMYSAGISAGAAPVGIVQAVDGNFWFTEFGANRIARVTPTGTVTEFTLAAGRGPVNITNGPDNNVWFTENTGDRIGNLNPMAGSDAAIQASLNEFTVPGAGSAPNGIATGPDGALWFTETGSDQIGRITTAGVVTNEFVVPGVGSSPAGITAGSDGALWFTEAGSGQIGRISLAGVITEFLIPVGTAGFSDPESIAAGPNGDLFFTDFGRSQIGRITTAGAITQFNLPINRGPQGLTVAPDGDLYFTEAASGRIGRLSASALIPGRPTSGSPPLEEFDFIPSTSAPLGITTDGKGDIWFTLNGTNAIGYFIAHLEQVSVTATGSTVQVFNRKLEEVRSFTPFPGFQGTVSVAVADLNANGIPDSIVGAGPGGGPHVMVFDSSDNRVLASFFAFDPAYTGGVTLASDDVNGDGRPDIIVAAGNHIKVIDGFFINQVDANGVISNSALIASFYAFDPNYTGSINLASLDLNGDNRNDIVVGAGPGSSRVMVIDAARLNQVQANGVIADSALIASFFAFGPTFTGGVYVAVAFNDVQRKIVVGAGAGGSSHVKIIDGKQLTNVDANGVISDRTLFASFYAFDPRFTGGVRVGSDDLSSDGLAEVILSAGPGGGPHVKVVDGSLVNQVLANGVIADSALRSSFFTTGSNLTGGVFIASDADHRDGPVNGPPGITVTNSRRDVNDMFIFQSPTNPANSVLIMDVSPFSTGTTPAMFEPGVLYDFRIANRDLINTTDDIVFRVAFGPPDPNANNRQDVSVRALPAARFVGSGGVIAKGFTNSNIATRGVGGNGSQFRAAEQDDPFFFDSSGFSSLLNSTTAVAGVVAGKFPHGTGTFGPGGTPNYDSTNFFGPNVNTLSIILEIPSTVLTTATSTAVGFWGRTEFNGVQFDRMGLPAINTALIPPVPRGSNFPIGQGGQNSQERRLAFNLGVPRDDRANFRSDVVSVLTSFYPAGRPGGVPNVGQATALANLLLPDILVYDTTSNAGFGSVVTVGGTTFLGNGRKLSDDIISTELAVLTDDDLPAAFGGGPNQPAIVTQNVRDDNAQKLTNGSIDKSIAQGGMGTGQRLALFPYIGARNPAPTPVPGTPPPQ